MYRRTWLIGLTIITGIVLGSLTVPLPAHSSSALKLEITTSPEVKQIIPDQTLARTTVRLLDEKGEPIRDARVRIHVDNPARARLWNTDFPWVEGTPLLELDTWTTDGTVTWEMMYPIRGRYTFEVTAILPDGREMSGKGTLKLRENPAEVRNFLILVVLLISVGLGSGYWIGRGQYTHTTSVALGLALTFLTFTPVAWAHGSPPQDSAVRTEDVQLSAQEGEKTANVTLSPGTGRVGTMNTVRVQVQDSAGNPLPAQVTVEAWHLEDEYTVYRFNLNIPDGETTLRMQFFDGAPHDLRFFITTADGTSFKLNTPIDVVGLAPPLYIKLRVLGFLLLPVLLGLVGGIWWGRRPRKNPLAPIPA